jgi:group I intron endonuclease
MIIYKAILKYGYSNFSFEVLEYCEKNILLEREQFYIDSLNPEYNLSPTAGSSLGRSVSAETRIKMSNAQKGKYIGDKHHFFGKTHSDETKEKLSIAKGTKVFVFSLNFELFTSFPSYSAAARHNAIA